MKETFSCSKIDRYMGPPKGVPINELLRAYLRANRECLIIINNLCETKKLVDGCELASIPKTKFMNI